MYLWVQYYGDALLEVPNGLVRIWSAHEMSLQHLAAKVPGVKYFLTHTFSMSKVRAHIFRLRPLCQIFWTLSNNIKRIHMPYPWLQRPTPSYLPDQNTE